MKDKATQALEPDDSTENNLDEAPGDETSSLVVRRKNARNVTFNSTQVPEMDQSVLILQFLQSGKSRKVWQTMCLSKLCSEA